jgi:hypothetical protein
MLIYYAITALNIVLMLWLAWRWPSPRSATYLIAMALSAALQNTIYWGMWDELTLAIFGAMWTLSLLPTSRRGRVEALSIGVVLAAFLMVLLPRPWPMYSHEMYYTRIYSAAAFLGISVPCAWLKRGNWLAIPWWGAVLSVAGISEQGWDYRAVAICANLTWTACLIGWLIISRRPDASPASS